MKKEKTHVMEIFDVSINLNEHALSKKELEIEIKHNCINTLIDFSKLSHTKIIFYDNNDRVINKIELKEKGGGPFFMLTQAKRIKILRLNIKKT